MRKTFKLALALLIALFTLPLGHTAFADAKAYDDIKDGEYDITAKAINADTGERSGAAGFISEDAKLSVKNGKVEFTITIPNNEMAEIKGLQIEKNEPTIDKAEEKKHMTYKLKDLKSELNAQVQYEVPSMNMDHDVPFKFVLEGLDQLPVKEEVEEPETPKESQKDKDQPGNDEKSDSKDKTKKDDNEKDTDKPKDEKKSNDSRTEKPLIKDADKSYKVKYITDSPSTKRQFNNPVTLLIKDGKKYIEMSGTGGKMIDSLTINGTEVTWIDEDEDGSFVIQFELPDSLSEEVSFGMVIDTGVPGMDKMKHDIPLSFEIPAELQDPVKVPKEDSKKDPKEEPKVDPKVDPKENSKEEPKGADLLAIDKAYEINYIIKHATKDEVSAADNFFRKPGILLEKDGGKYIQLTVDNWDWIVYLKTAHGDVNVVKINKDGSAVVQFKVDGDLSDVINLDMHIVVPKEIAGMEYDMKHAARLFLDTASMKEIDSSKYEIGTPRKGDQLNPPGKNDGKGEGLDNGTTPKKPKFGSNVDNNKATNATKNESAQNPQTGDTSGILLYTLLLIGSLIPLVVKLKRRFI